VFFGELIVRAALDGGAIHDNGTNIIQLGQKVPGASRLL
jgi:hypothetical protein